MFRSNAIRIAQRISDVLDDMLVGDFDCVEHGSRIYADIDYDRTYSTTHAVFADASLADDFEFHPHREPLRSRVSRRPSGLDCNPPATEGSRCPGRLPEQWETTNRGTAAT
jgi:hypothetical protein